MAAAWARCGMDRCCTSLLCRDVKPAPHFAFASRIWVLQSRLLSFEPHSALCRVAKFLQSSQFPATNMLPQGLPTLESKKWKAGLLSHCTSSLLTGLIIILVLQVGALPRASWQNLGHILTGQNWRADLFFFWFKSSLQNIVLAMTNWSLVG